MTERLPPGTPLYMAPEQARGEPYLWPQADLFAMGCVLFEMLTGTPYRKAQRRRKRLRDLRPDVPDWLVEVLDRTLAREPEERFESAYEMAEALEEEARRRKREEEARRKKQAARARRLAGLRRQAEQAAKEGRWEEARRAAEAWLELEEDSRAQEILALARLERTPSGLVIATPENLADLLALPQPPARVWWKKAGMEFCLVPAGEFPMGISEEEARRWHEEFGGKLEWYLDATPQHTVDLPAYYIGRYPVTQAQYARFVQETDHRVPYVNPKEHEWARPYNWDRRRKRPPQGLEDHPVVLVSWEDAVAYCEWAGLRLPTEAEWEKAARGTDGRLYPWGNEWDRRRCNSAEKWAGRALRTYYEWGKWVLEMGEKGWGDRVRTTPVGAYSPKGDGPYGCADMAGNVLEWCADWYKGYPHTTCQRIEFGETYRVLRGGSWGTLHGGVRSASRDWDPPDYLSVDYGFRCCLSPT